MASTESRVTIHMTLSVTQSRGIFLQIAARSFWLLMTTLMSILQCALMPDSITRVSLGMSLRESLKMMLPLLM